MKKILSIFIALSSLFLVSCHRATESYPVAPCSETYDALQKIPEVEEVILSDWYDDCEYVYSLFLSGGRFLQIFYSTAEPLLIRQIGDCQISWWMYSFEDEPSNPLRELQKNENGLWVRRPMHYEDDDEENTAFTEELDDDKYFYCDSSYLRKYAPLYPSHLAELFGIKAKTVEDFIKNYDEILESVKKFPDTPKNSENPYLTAIFYHEKKDEHRDDLFPFAYSPFSFLQKSLLHPDSTDRIYFFKTTDLQLFYYGRPLRLSEISEDFNSLPNVESAEISEIQYDENPILIYFATVKTLDGHTLELLLRAARPAQFQDSKGVSKRILVCRFLILTFDGKPIQKEDGYLFENEDLDCELRTCFGDYISEGCPSYRELFTRWADFLEVIKKPVPRRPGGA